MLKGLHAIVWRPRVRRPGCQLSECVLPYRPPVVTRLVSQWVEEGVGRFEPGSLLGFQRLDQRLSVRTDSAARRRCSVIDWRTDHELSYCAVKTYLDCYPCFLRQALSAARRAHASVELQRHILLETMDQLRALPADAAPPVMAERIHRMVRRLTDTPDPYGQSKRDATVQAMTLLPALRDAESKAKKIEVKAE